LAQLNEIKDSFFYLEKESKLDNFIQDSLGFFIQDNLEEKSFDMLLGDRIIRGIPHWVKYSGMKQVPRQLCQLLPISPRNKAETKKEK